MGNTYIEEEISPPLSHPSHPPIPRKLKTHPSTPSRTPLAPLAHPSTTHSARTQNSSHPAVKCRVRTYAVILARFSLVN